MFVCFMHVFVCTYIQTDIDLAFFLIFFMVKKHGNNRKTSVFKEEREKS